MRRIWMLAAAVPLLALLVTLAARSPAPAAARLPSLSSGGGPPLFYRASRGDHLLVVEAAGVGFVLLPWRPTV
mgnify:CR=1 FL=1